MSQKPHGVEIASQNHEFFVLESTKLVPGLFLSELIIEIESSSSIWRKGTKVEPQNPPQITG